MNVNTLLSELSNRGIVVTVSEESLELDAPLGVLRDTDLTRLRDAKQAVLDHLRSQCRPHNNPDNYLDTPDSNRPGWIRTTCRICGKFIGYRPDSSIDKFDCRWEL